MNNMVAFPVTLCPSMSPSPTQESALTFRASVIFQWLSQPTVSSSRSEVVQGAAKADGEDTGECGGEAKGCLMLENGAAALFDSFSAKPAF